MFEKLFFGKARQGAKQTLNRIILSGFMILQILYFQGIMSHEREMRNTVLSILLLSETRSRLFFPDPVFLYEIELSEVRMQKY